MPKVRVIERSREMSRVAALNYLVYHLILQVRKRHRLRQELIAIQNTIQAIAAEINKRKKEVEDGDE